MADQERRIARMVVGLLLCGLLTVVLVADPVADLLGWRIFMLRDAKLQAVWAGGAVLSFALSAWPSLRWVALASILFYVENLYVLFSGGGHLYFVALGAATTLILAGRLAIPTTFRRR